MSITVLEGDCRAILATLPAESVHCCVTSPPYFGLRDYGTAQWEGGDPACDHRKVADALAAVATSTLGGGKKSTGHLQEGFSACCGRCGARRIDSQIGLEPTPDAYVAELVAVFREVRRVLRNDGTLWLNLGDSYAGGGYAPNAPINQARNNGEGWGKLSPGSEAQRKATIKPNGGARYGLKPKDLIGIPWRVAFALQADGWWLRQDIIWSKPNPMPESVTDRCTKAHEYMFLLSKSAKYYFDAEGIKEESITDDPRRSYGSPGTTALDPRGAQGNGKLRAPANVKRGDFNGKTNDLVGREAFRAFTETRNRRSVWTVTTQPYSEAHFATFPPALIEPCILAGCPKDGMVLDPFGGAGTTGLVADRLGRNATLIELNPEYAEMTRERIKRDAGFFAEVEAPRLDETPLPEAPWVLL